MALATTTLAVACAATDKFLILASATSVAAGRLLRVDQEVMQVTQDYVSGTTVNVLRGRDGSKTVAHFITSAVTHGLATDFDPPVSPGVTGFPAQRSTVVQSITTTATSLVLPDAGCDTRVVINLATAATITVPVPTKDMDGDMLWFVSSTVAAHVLVFTGGFGGVGSGYTTLTASTGAQMCVGVIACNGTWNIPCFPHFASGTETKINSALS